MTPVAISITFLVLHIHKNNICIGSISAILCAYCVPIKNYYKTIVRISLMHYVFPVNGVTVSMLGVLYSSLNAVH